MRIFAALGLVAMTLSSSALAQSEETRIVTLEGKAASYVEALFGPDPAALDTFHDAAMKAAMIPAKVEEVVAGLGRQLGSVKQFGTAWHADAVQGYERFRVPIEFEKGTVDAQVVIDAEDNVTGLQFVPHAEPPSGETPEAPGEEREIEVGEGADTLPGLLLLPAGEAPFPGVVLVHGSGPMDRDETVGPNKPFRDLAWGLAERGVASLRFDKRSLAHPETLLAIGDALTVEDEVIADARRAVRTLATQPEVDGSRIFLLGHSLGGTVLPRIPNDTTPAAGMVVLAGTTLPFPETVVRQVEYIAGLAPSLDETQQQQIESIKQQMKTVRQAIDGEIEPPSGLLMGAPVGYYADLEAHPAAEIAARSERPILVLQGERDYQVTMDDFALWQKALKGKDFACLESYPTLDHLFHEGTGPSSPADYQARKPVAPQVIEDIAAWIFEARCPD